MKQRDYQRSKVYKFDRAARFELQGSLRESMTLNQCVKLISDVLYDHQQPGVIVSDGRGRRRGCANQSEIKLPRFARNPEYVLHEVAHVLVERSVHKHQTSWHGAIFVGVLCQLLSTYTDLSPSWCHEKVKEIGIDIDLKMFPGLLANRPEAA